MELIFLHGTAASGKLTTARALDVLLGYPVFHNHLVVDTLTTVFPFGSEPFVRLREEFSGRRSSTSSCYGPARRWASGWSTPAPGSRKDAARSNASSAPSETSS